MGLLAPLYALAALAIAGPILFHLIQRRPRGQMRFSSLMFLSPSPPRLTRRSRLDNWLLLLLRALAIGLIAFAFARPYLRRDTFLNSNLEGRNISVLLDTSASMQREDVWRASLDTLRQLLDSLSPEDRIALYTVDDSVHTIVPLDGDSTASTATSVQSVRATIDHLKPSWRRTELAEGLRAVADLMSAASISGTIDAGAENQIVLISDLHTSSGLESLQGFPWPETIQLDVRQSLPAVPGNARPSLITSDESMGIAEEAGFKMRIENNPDSKEQTFQMVWVNDQGPIAETASSAQVPAGQVRVLPATARPAGATRLMLSGDAWSGDNTVYVAETKPTVERIAFVGPRQERDEDNLSYFLEKAPLNTALIQREVFLAEPPQLDLSDPLLQTVVIEPTDESDEFARQLRAFADRGATVILSLARPADDPSRQSRFLTSLTGVEGLEIGEAEVKDFALLSAVDYKHPVFAPFADPRFNDFSKLRFWSHRVLTFPGEQSPLRVVASFDDQTPMLLEQSIGEGRLWILTSGWQPAAGSLALSSKFVPILMGMLDPSGRALERPRSYEVGEPMDIRNLSSGITVLREDGGEADRSLAVVKSGSVEFQEPGLFFIRSGDQLQSVAVQVPALESQLLPLDTDVFEQYGIALGMVTGEAERRQAMRQLQVEELESKQRLWQWLIAVGLAVLAVETWLAGSLARRNRRELSTAG